MIEETQQTSDRVADHSRAKRGDVTLNELADRLRAGDLSAIEDIWRYFGSDLRRRARTRLRQYGIAGHAESMDICNAVLLELVRKQEILIRSPADLLRYVGRAIDHEVLDVIKGLTRDRRDIRRVASNPVEEHNVMNGDSTPSACLIRNELLSCVERELGRDGKRILSLYLSNHGWNEIGEELKIAPDTARMRWSRAIQSLKDRIRPNRTDSAWPADEPSSR